MAALGSTPTDVFPYRHRVGEIMSAPLISAEPALGLGQAAALMIERGISALAILDVDQRPVGIVTDRDVLGAMGLGGAALDQTLGAIASQPVHAIAEDAFVYVALGRMARLGVKHLVVTGSDGRASGMLTLRALVKLRAGSALAIGDEIASAHDVADLRHARDQIFGLARALRDEDISSHAIAALLSAVLEDLTAASARLAVTGMAADRAWGPPPAPWCLLLLGSGGRRESLLGPDQDNAIIHAGAATDDAWFAEAGKRIADNLDAAGVPYCRGGIMGMNREWRRDQAEWRDRVARWIKSADGKDLLDVDIFLDLRPVYGTGALALDLGAHAREMAGASPRFLQAMNVSVAGMRPGLGWFGEFRTDQGRLDLKLAGLLPLVSTARLLALRHASPATSTPERLRAAAAAGTLSDDEAEVMIGHHGLMLRLLIDQQTADHAAGLPLSNRVEIRRLAPRDRRALKAALRAVRDYGSLLASQPGTR